MEKKEIDGNTTTEKITTIIDQPKTVGNTSAITVENGTELTIGEVRTVTVNQPQIAGASSAITVENGTVLTSVHDNDNDNMLQECLDVFASYIIVVDQYLKEGAEELADYNGDNWGRELVAECAQGYLGRGGNVSVGRIAGVIGKSIWDLGSGVSAGSITMVSHPLETIENVPAALGDVATTYVDGNWTQKLELTLEIAGIFNGFAKLKRMGKSSATEAGKLAGAEETVGAIDGVVGEAGGIVGSEGVAAVEGAAGEAAEAIEGTAGKGKIRIESAGESGSGSAIPNSVDIRLNSLVDEIRTDIGKEYPVGNVGAAITDIEGVTSEIKAYSKINNSISSPNINHEYSYNLGSNNRIFETVDVNSQNIVNGPKAFNRCIDTESKILEDIAHQLGYNTFAVDESVVGNVYLITERAPCPSCESVIAQFKEMFPNVNVEVKYMY